MATGSPHPDVIRLVAQFAEMGVLRYDQLGVLRARAVLDGVTRLQGERVTVDAVNDILVPGAAGAIPARVYHPEPGASLPLIVYIHGGGWVLGGVRVADRPCRRLAVEAGCVVVSLEYRLAPETRFPGPLEDCLAALRWVARNAAALGARTGPFTLLGDSAGGNLVAASAAALRDEGVALRRQILVYPVLAPARASPHASMTEHADGPLMTRAELEWFWSLYLRSPEDEGDPRAVPLAAASLSGLPPTTLVAAELDPLRDEGLAYAQRLRDDEVPVEVTVYPGAAHGFWWMDAAMTQAHELTAQLAAIARAR